MRFEGGVQNSHRLSSLLPLLRMRRQMAFLDVLDTMSDREQALTEHEYDEWGDPLSEAGEGGGRRGGGGALCCASLTQEKFGDCCKC